MDVRARYPMSELVVIRSSTPPPLWEHLNPARMVRVVWENRELIRNFARRDLAERHKGAVLGAVWNVMSQGALSSGQ